MKYLIIIIILSALVLNGCATLHLPDQEPVYYNQKIWKQRYQYLKRITKWNISGAFSIYQPNKMIIASYNWKQKDQNYHIRIYSSLSAYSVNIFGRPGMVMLSYSPKNNYEARTSAQLIQRQLDWPLPLYDLYYWIRGIPAERKSYHGNFDIYFHLITLQQNGWCIHFSKYISVGLVDFPRILQLNNSQLKIKIVITHWKL